MRLQRAPGDHVAAYGELARRPVLGRLGTAYRPSRPITRTSGSSARCSIRPTRAAIQAEAKKHGITFPAGLRRRSRLGEGLPGGARQPHRLLFQPVQDRVVGHRAWTRRRMATIREQDQKRSPELNLWPSRWRPIVSVRTRVRPSLRRRSCLNDFEPCCARWPRTPRRLGWVLAPVR